MKYLKIYEDYQTDTQEWLGLISKLNNTLSTIYDNNEKTFDNLINALRETNMGNGHVIKDIYRKDFRWYVEFSLNILEDRTYGGFEVMTLKDLRIIWKKLMELSNINNVMLKINT